MMQVRWRVIKKVWQEVMGLYKAVFDLADGLREARASCVPSE
jgi:hypothetical protein